MIEIEVDDVSGNPQAISDDLDDGAFSGAENCSIDVEPNDGVSQPTVTLVVPSHVVLYRLFSWLTNAVEVYQDMNSWDSPEGQAADKLAVAAFDRCTARACGRGHPAHRSTLLDQPLVVENPPQVRCPTCDSVVRILYRWLPDDAELKQGESVDA